MRRMQILLVVFLIFFLVLIQGLPALAGNGAHGLAGGTRSVLGAVTWLLLLFVVLMIGGLLYFMKKSKLKSYPSVLDRQMELMERSEAHMNRVEEKPDRLIEAVERSNRQKNG